MNNKLFSLQYLRGIAAFFVVLYHATVLFKKYYNYDYLFDLFNTGYMGVDVFFILSGFIIFYVHYWILESKKDLNPF